MVSGDRRRLNIPNDNQFNIEKGMTMENTLLLNKRINELLKKKLSNCGCNPCTCSERRKDLYFQELKGVLEIFNIEKFASYSNRSVTDKQLSDKF